MRKYYDDKLAEITCNNCGDSVNVLNDDYGHIEEPYREFDLVYGYGSVLYDFSGVKFDLCEHCVKKITDNFKIPVESRDYGLVQGFSSDGEPFAYYSFENDKPVTQEELDEMYERLSKQGEKDDD